MAISEYATNSQAATLDTEHTLSGDNTDDGVYQIWIETNAMVRVDRTVIRVYEKIVSSGTQRKVAEWVLLNDQVEEAFISPSLILMHSWKVTLEQTDGAAGRTYPWSIRRVS